MPIEYTSKHIASETMLKLRSEASFNTPIWDKETSEMARLEQGCFSLAYGFKLCWELDISAMRIVIELKWNDISLGKWVLDTTHTCVHIGVNYSGCGVSLDLCVDWNKGEVELKGEVDYIIGKKTFDVVLFKW